MQTTISTLICLDEVVRSIVVLPSSFIIMMTFVRLLMAASLAQQQQQAARQQQQKVTTRFVLLPTHHPGNVGAVARAMKTMGFDNETRDELVLVEPRDPRVLNRQRTNHGASGAMDVLQRARIASCFDDAVHGTDIWCATGMPTDMHRRRTPRTYVAPREYFPQLLQQQQQQQPQNEIRIAFLFGNEKQGMREEDMDRAHVLLGIPTNPSFGSLNLASAVQLIAYDWRQALGGFDIRSTP